MAAADEQRRWLQQQLTKLLAWDASVVESIAEGLENATDANHVATIFKQQYLAKRAKEASTRSGTSVTYRQAPAGKGRGGRSRAAESPKGAAGLAAQLDRRVVNCLGCGKIFHCTQPLSSEATRFLESGGVCTFCNKPVALYARGEQVVPSVGQQPSVGQEPSVGQQPSVGQEPSVGQQPSAGARETTDAVVDEQTAAAVALKQRLLEYDRNSTQRTTVVDDQSDYFAIESNTWLSDEERAALRAQQEAVERAAEARRGRIVVTFDLLGRQVVVAEGAEGGAGGEGGPGTAGPGPSQGPSQGGALFVPSRDPAGPPEMACGGQGRGGPVVGGGGHGARGGGVEGGGVEEGPLRAVVNPAAHVVPTFTQPSAAQLARTAVLR